MQIDNPFDGEASRYQKEDGATEQVARDLVVLKYLRVGDTRPLAFWLERDCRPGQEICRYLSLMLQPEREDSQNPQERVWASLEIVPFELVAKDRRTGKTGRPVDLVAAERNTALNERYKKLIEEHGSGSSEAAIAQLFEELAPDVSESQIREARKKRSRKSSSGK